MWIDGWMEWGMRGSIATPPPPRYKKPGWNHHCKETEKKLTINQQHHHHQRHQATLSIMHIEAITHPLLRLRADPPFPAVRWDQVLPKVRAQVFHDGAGLGDGGGGLLGGGLDGDDGGFAEGVDRFELGPGEHVCAAGVGAQVVGEGELFEEPEDALGAGFFEPGEGLGLGEWLWCLSGRGGCTSRA